METDLQADPPTADELAWEATRSGLAVLDAEHRQWFEDVARFVYDRWPEDEVDVPDPDDEERVEELEKWGRDLFAALEELGCETIETTEDGVEVSAVVERVRAYGERERAEGVKDATVPSRANTAARKAMRLLVEGRVVVRRVVTEGDLANLVVAEVRGDSGETYTLGHDPRRRQWRCTCPEMRGDCSHIAAVKMVTSIVRGDPAP